LCLRFPAENATLNAQVAAATVRSRENTGAGFYTRFDVVRASLAPLVGERMRSAGWAKIDGLENPMGFVLWLKDGYVDCLEGFTTVDSTVGMDLAALTFEIESLSN
jgi:hypothetical protein